MANQTELRAAAARLLYSDNRDTADYNMLIDFIDSTFREKQGQVAPEKPPTDLRGKCGGCAYAVTVPACGSTFAYVQCTNPLHLATYGKRYKSGIRQRTTKACKKYLQREGL